MVICRDCKFLTLGQRIMGAISGSGERYLRCNNPKFYTIEPVCGRAIKAFCSITNGSGMCSGFEPKK